MYTPAAFAETDTGKIHDFIRSHSFATVVTDAGSGMVASHLPLLLDANAGQSGTLIGHMARANPQWRSFRGEALVIFHGPHAYVSPAWYREEGTVPTWNYAVVHAYGPIRLVEERSGILDILRRSVEAYEGPRADPWAFDETAGHVDKLIAAIVGFRIEISRLEGKWKLSQNHSEVRRTRVVEALGRQPDEDSRAIAALMSGEHPS